ncbi:MAG: insulinase family protein [Kofleriaceae bacterium]
MAWLAACGTLRVPPEPDRRLNVKSTGTMFESNNGYRFAALPEPNTSVVRVSVRYPVGAADDPPGKEGLAHLVEHLLFDVEIDRDGQKTSIGAQLGRIAQWWNAETTLDHTSYETMVLPDSLDELIRLEVDRLTVGCAGLTREIVAREREVVLNELRWRRGTSGAAMMKQINEAVFPEHHPYRAVDTIESVSKLQLEDVCGFLVGPYRRGKAIVVASGAVTGASLQAAAGHHFGRAARRDVTTKRAVPPVAEPQTGTLRIKGDVDEPTLMVTWPLPPMHSRDYRILAMAWPYMPGRLEGFALTYNWGHSAGISLLGGAHAPVLALSVTLDSADKLDDAITAAKKAAEYSFRAVHRAGEADEDSWRYVWQNRVESVLASWESLGDRNDTVADFMQYEAGDTVLVGRVEELVTSKGSAARALAETWLSPDRARFLLIEPDTATVGTRRKTYQGGAEAHAVFVDPALADRPLLMPQALPTLQSERYTLANGLRVVLWPHGASPIVQGRLIVDSGRAHEPAGQEGVSSFVGADAVGEDTMVYTGRALSTRVDDLVKQLAMELRSPGYELSDEVKGVMRGQLRLARAKERMTFTHAYLAALYGADHPYARMPMTEDSLDHISRDSVMSWARSHVVPKNSILVLAGSFDPALVKKHVVYNTDMVSAGSNSPVQVREPVSQQAFVPGISAKPSPTVFIDVGFVGGRGVDRDHARRLVLAAVLESQLGQLRARKALSYGFGAEYEARPGGGLWSIAGDVDAARAGEAAAAIITILGDMRANPESYRTAFVLARQKVLEGLLVDTTSSAGIVRQLSYLARFDIADDFYARVAQSVAGLTLATFHPFLAKELAASGQVFGAFGNADAVQEAIKAAKAVPPAAAGIVDPFK